MSQALKGTPFTFLFSVYNEGDLTDFDTTPTLTVTDAAGATVSTGALVNSTTGVYQATITAQTNVAELSAQLVGNISGNATTLTQDVSIVGNLVFTEAEARAFDDARLNSFTDAQISEARERVTNMFEEYCNVSFVPRYARVKFSGANRRDAWLLSPLRGIRLDGGAGYGREIQTLLGATDNTTAVSTANVEVYESGFRLTSGSWTWPTTSNPFPQTLAYEYGYASVPLDIKQAALILARHELSVKDVTDRMISYQDALGGVRLSTPGPNRPTGLPVVDETLNRYRRREVVL